MFCRKLVSRTSLKAIYIRHRHARGLCGTTDNDGVPFYDVVVSGGGMVGSVMASVLGHESWFANKKICLLEAAPRKEFVLQERFSNRTCALSPSTRALLESIGAWEKISEMRYQPVKKMQVWDSCSDAMISFGNLELLDDLAYIVENDVIQSAIDHSLELVTDRVEVRHSARVKRYGLDGASLHSHSPKSHWAQVELETGELLNTRLIIGADGFRSPLRTAAKIRTVGWDYDQMGVCAVLKLSEPTDNNVAWQRFLPTGPIAMLPLSNEHSCLIWSTSTDDAKNLLKLGEESFVDAVNNAFWSDDCKNTAVDYPSQLLDNFLLTLGLQGSSSQQLPPTIINIDSGSRAAFPLGLCHATHYVKSRMALIGWELLHIEMVQCWRTEDHSNYDHVSRVIEDLKRSDAAHRVHPLAGQGANLGFSDVACLREVLVGALKEGADIGSLTHLLRYETQQQRSNIPIMAGVDLISRLYGTQATPVVMARSLGLQLTNALTPVKDLFMKQARGT